MRRNTKGQIVVMVRICANNSTSRHIILLVLDIIIVNLRVLIQ